MSEKIRLYVDAVDGDYDRTNRLSVAQRVVMASRKFISENPSVDITLGGSASLLEELLGESDRIRVVDGSGLPSDLSNGRESTALSIGLDGLKKGEYDALHTIGDTRAVVLYSARTVGRFKGIQAAPLLAELPTINGRRVLFLDAGASVDSQGKNLLGMALLAHAYCKGFRGIDRPRIGLLSNGHEDYKGSLAIREANEELRRITGINYIGQVEPSSWVKGEVDAVVGDGLLMNSQLKLTEALIEGGKTLLREEVNRLTLLERLLALGGLWRIKKNLRKRFAHEEHSGAPLLVRGVVIKDHGLASSEDVYNGLRKAVFYAEKDLPGVIQRELNEINIT